MSNAVPTILDARPAPASAAGSAVHGVDSRPVIFAAVGHATGSVVLGLLTAFVGMIATMLATLSIAMRLDRLWKIVRRAAGHEQKEGMLERIFVVSMVVGGTAFLIWLLVIQGPGPELAPRGG